MKKKWVKVLSLIAVLSLLSVHLTACGGSSSGSTAESTAESTVEEAAESTAEAAEETVEEEAEEPSPEESTVDTDVEEIEEEDASAAEQAEEPAAADTAEDEDGEYFVMTYMSNGDEEYTEDILTALNAGYMILRPDGTGEMNIMGDAIELTWDEAGVTAEGETLPYDRNGDVIHFEQADDDTGTVIVIEFTKGERPAEEESAEPAALDYDPTTRAGYYDLETMSDEDGNAATAAQLKALDMQFFLVLNEDNTGRLYMMGMDLPITWDDGAISFYGTDMDYSYEEGRVTITYEGSTMIFAYAGTPDMAPAEEEGTVTDESDLEDIIEDAVDEAEDAA